MTALSCASRCVRSLCPRMRITLNSNRKQSTIESNKLQGRRKVWQKRVKNGNSPSDAVKLHIVGNGGRGNPRVVFVSTDTCNYLFNCGEGTQRLTHENRLNLFKLWHVLLTQRSVENLSGLPGLMLTCQHMGVKRLTLHGPTNIDKYIQNYVEFMTVNGHQIIYNSHLENAVFDDNEMQIKSLPIFMSPQNCRQTGFDHLMATNPSFVYVCQLRTKAGDLIVKKCVELKVPAGPLIDRLKAGEDVVLADKRIIRPQDVMAADEVGPIFVILECPTVDYIDSLLSNEELKLYQYCTDLSKLVSVIFHFSPPHVMNDDRYKKWMSAFDTNVTHLALNDENPTESLTSVYKLQTQLNLVDSEIFPLLSGDPSKSSNSLLNAEEEQTNKTLLSPTMLTYVLRPSNMRGLNKENVINFDKDIVLAETLSNEEFIDNLKDYRNNVSLIRDKKQLYPEIIFLGTGSAIPSNTRNTSAIWVSISADTSLMLDCAEGTLGQLYRFFGDQLESKLKTLKAIYVSHFHADHHFGLSNIIKKRYSILGKPLTLIVPPIVDNWLFNYDNYVGDIRNCYASIPNSKFLDSTDEQLLIDLELSEFKTVFVEHCNHSFGLSFITNTEPKYKIVYSGDAMPTPALAELGRNCDLLIHEATMEDDLLSEAIMKAHSTTSQAIDMGKKMNAKFTILTHFSQRYPKIPFFNEKFNESVGIAFDNMRVRMSDFYKLPLMTPVFKSLFVQHLEKYEDLMVRRQRRQELINEYMENIKRHGS